MDLTIHTYGYYEAIYNVMQGLAMFRNSPFYPTLVNSLAGFVGIYYGIRMAFGNWRQFMLPVFGMVMLVNGLLMPKTDMLIKDHVTKTIGKVDNLPVAFALPIGMIEDFGHIITIGFEQVFAPMENIVDGSSNVFSYYHYGMLFGARLKKEISQTKIKDPEFVGNMRNFIKRCVARPAAIGHQFTKEELLLSQDMWKLVSERAGTLTRVDLTVAGTRTSMTCKEAAEHFEQAGTGAWDREYDRINAKYAFTDFGKARSTENYMAPSSSLSQVFAKNVRALHGGVEPAGKVLRQQMMINSLSDYRSGSYGVARARMQQEASSTLASDLATLYLPMMLVVFKCIVYAAFMFVIPLMLMPGGWKKYGIYLTIITSLQLWPAINSVLNMIIGTYSHLSVDSDMLISFSTASTVTNHVDTIVTVAGILQGIAVPLLAYGITSLGAGGLMQAAGSMSSALQQAAGSIGSEVSSGNRSIDNVNENNSQRNMHNANKLDTNRQYFDGVNSVQMQDGGIKRTNADGSEIFSGGAGSTTSTGSRQFTDETGIQNQISQGIQQSDAMLTSDRRSFSEAKSATMNDTADFVAHLAQREHNGESFNYDLSSDQGKALRQAVNHTKSLKEHNNYGWNQAAGMSLEAHAKGNIPFSGLTGVDIGGGISGEVSASNVSDQSAGNETGVNRENHTDSSYNNIVRAASNSSWAKENSIDTSLSDRVSKSLNDEKRIEQQLSKSQEQSDNYHQAQTRLGNEGATMRVDKYDDVMGELVKGGHARSKEEARSMIEKGNPVVDQVWNGMSHRKLDGIMHGIESGRNRVSDNHVVRDLNNFTNDHKGRVNNDASEELLTAMEVNGFDTKQVRANIATQEAHLKKQHISIAAENSTQYGAVKQYNEMEGRRIQNKTDKYEEDRIGQGYVAKGTAENINWITQDKTGNRIGGPDKESGLDYDNSTKPKAKSNKPGDKKVTEVFNDINTLKDMPEIIADKGMERQLKAFNAKTVKPRSVDEGAFQKGYNNNSKVK